MIILFATDQLQVREIAETQIREKLIFFNSVFFRFDAIPNFFEIRFDGWKKNSSKMNWIRLALDFNIFDYFDI